MNRRGFLGVLGAGLAGYVLDPERAIWLPGAKTYFLPTPRPQQIFRAGQLLAFDAQGRICVAHAQREVVGVVHAVDRYGVWVQTNGPVVVNAIIENREMQIRAFMTGDPYKAGVYHPTTGRMMEASVPQEITEVTS